MVVNRMRYSRASPSGAGSARSSIRKKLLRIRRIREVQFMLPEFVDRTGGSNRVQAQPAGSKWNRALPGAAGSACLSSVTLYTDVPIDERASPRACAVRAPAGG